MWDIFAHCVDLVLCVAVCLCGVFVSDPHQRDLYVQMSVSTKIISHRKDEKCRNLYININVYVLIYTS